MINRETFTLERLRSIEDVDAGTWDRLAENDVYAQHGWLRVLEKTVVEASDPVYFLLREGKELVGAAVCYRLDAVGSSLDEMWFGRLYRSLTRLGFSLSPALYCGPLLGQGRHVLWRREAPKPERLLARLLDAVSAFAAEKSLALAVAKLPIEEGVLLEMFAGRGFARTMNWPVSYVDIRWGSFDAYVGHLAALGSSMATKARREIAGPGKTGILLGGIEHFENLSQEVLELIEANQRAHSDTPLGLKREFFETLAQSHGASSIVTVASANGKLAGAALLLTAGDCAGGPLIGVSEDVRNRKAFTYFNLALYEPIRFCIEHGLKRIYLGAGLYDMKRRRGCRELELAMLIRPRRMLGRIACRFWCVAHRRWAVKKLERQGVRLLP
ncbi:MAG: GNAT family N-acetyltransferase [Gammaproteobacteria bacterium]|nr:GNAT family N-acetyltransferase [Gammaproteobacteria bacterium]